MRPAANTNLQAPRYIAIIADGNGRWAQAHGMPVTAGHEAGADTLKARLRDAVEFGIEELTLYSFSTENWSRPIEEVQGLISMLARRIAAETPQLHREGVRMRFIGRRAGVPREMLHQMKRAETLTDSNRRLTLFIAFNYGGRAEILDAAKRLQGNTEEEFRRCLYAPEMHDPDLIIRTGGEQRLSNFLLWQTADSEFVIRDELWPDFTRQSLIASLAEFNERQRRRTITQDPSPKSVEQRANGQHPGTTELGLKITLSNDSILPTPADRTYRNDQPRRARLIPGSPAAAIGSR